MGQGVCGVGGSPPVGGLGGGCVAGAAAAEVDPAGGRSHCLYEASKGSGESAECFEIRVRL